MGRAMKGRAMGAARIAIGARIGALLAGAPCHWPTAATGSSAKITMGSGPRIRIPHPALYRILPDRIGGARLGLALFV